MKYKSAIVSAGIVILINFIVYYLLIPYAQKNANSHMNPGPVFGVIFYILASIVLLYMTLKSFNGMKKVKIYSLSALFISFIFWGYQMRTMHCMLCAKSG